MKDKWGKFRDQQLSFWGNILGFVVWDGVSWKQNKGGDFPIWLTQVIFSYFRGAWFISEDK